MSKLKLYLLDNPGFWGLSGMYKLIVELGILSEQPKVIAQVKE
jgi:hypothetical protein